MDISSPNPLETIQPGNKYSNHHYNLAIDFPDDWQHDRGLSDYTLFRAFQRDSGLTMSLIVIPLHRKYKGKEGLTSLKFNDSPMQFMDQVTQGNYRKYLVEQLTTQLGQPPIDLEITETSIGSHKYIVTEYKIKQMADDFKYYMYGKSFTTQQWNHTYEISYFAPEDYYKPELLTPVMMSFRIMNPGAFNK